MRGRSGVGALRFWLFLGVKRMLVSFVLRLVLVLTALLSACHAFAQDSVKVALNIPLSGPFANVGELYVKNAQFLAEQINARGGVLGRRLEILAFDNKNSPQEALMVLKHIADRRIPFVMQSGGSHIAVPLSEAVERHNMREPDNQMLFLDEPGDQELTNEKCSFWTFMFMANAEIKMEALTNHVSRQKNIKRVYLINQDYQFGHQVRQFAREMLARKRPDITIVGDDLHPLGKVKDFSPYVAKMKSSGTDAVITGNWGQDMSLLVKAAKDAGMSAGFFTYYGLGPGAPTAMGDAAVGRVRTIWRWHKNMPLEKEQQAAQDYSRRFGLEYYGMPLTNLLEMLTKAVDKAGSTDALKVAYALEDMRIRGPLGEVWMRPDDHQLFEPLFILVPAKVDGKDVKYDMEATGIGPRTEARIEASELKLPTMCKMQRPTQP